MENLRYKGLWEDYWRDRSSHDAVGRLVDAFLPLVRKVLARIRIRIPSHVQQDDLIQSGLIGLFESIERYDPSKGSSFDAYAMIRIRGAIMDELRRDDTLSRDVRDKYNNIKRTMEVLSNETGRAPSDAELAGRLGMEESELQNILERAAPIASLDDAVMGTRDGREIYLRDILDDAVVPPDVAAEKRDMVAVLCRAFRGLSDREKKILYLYYHEFLRVKEIAVIFEISEARVCQIHAVALSKLRAIIDSETSIVRHGYERAV